MNSVLLLQFADTQYLSIPSVSSVKNVDRSAFLKSIFRPSKVTTGTMAPMEDTDWAMEPGFAPTDSVVHWCVIGHCVGVVAAHGASQANFFSPPTPPHPFHSTPPHPISPHPTRHHKQ